MTAPTYGHLFSQGRIREQVRARLEKEFEEELSGGLAPAAAVVELAQKVIGNFEKRLPGVHPELAWRAEGVYRTRDGAALPTSEKQLKRLLGRAMRAVFEGDAPVGSLGPHWRAAEAIMRVGDDDSGPAILVPRVFSFEAHPQKFGQDMARKMLGHVAQRMRGDLAERPDLYVVVNSQTCLDHMVIKRIFEAVDDPEAGAQALRAYENFKRALFPTMS